MIFQVEQFQGNVNEVTNWLNGQETSPLPVIWTPIEIDTTETIGYFNLNEWSLLAQNRATDWLLDTNPLYNENWAIQLPTGDYRCRVDLDISTTTENFSFRVKDFNDPFGVSNNTAYWAMRTSQSGNLSITDGNSNPLFSPEPKIVGDWFEFSVEHDIWWGVLHDERTATGQIRWFLEQKSFDFSGNGHRTNFDILPIEGEAFVAFNAQFKP